MLFGQTGGLETCGASAADKQIPRARSAEQIDLAKIDCSCGGELLSGQRFEIENCVSQAPLGPSIALSGSEGKSSPK